MSEPRSYRVSWRPAAPFGPLTASAVFGALCWAWRDLFGAGALADLLSSFSDGEPAFRLSEPAPFQGARNPVRFLPAPVLPGPDLARYSHDHALALSASRRWHRLGGIQWISEDLLGTLAHGTVSRHRILEETTFAGARSREVAEVRCVAFREWWMTRDEFLRLPVDAAGRRWAPWQAFEQRRFGGRGCSAGGFRAGGWTAHGGGVHLRLACGEAALERLEPAFSYLGRTGIGRRRSTGWGRFEALSIDPAEVLSPVSGAVAWMTLTRAIPTPEEASALAASERSSYALLRYEGRLGEARPGDDASKAPVWCLQAGSILERPIEGRCPVVRRDGDVEVVQYGVAINVPVAGTVIGPAAVAS